MEEATSEVQIMIEKRLKERDVETYINSTSGGEKKFDSMASEQEKDYQISVNNNPMVQSDEAPDTNSNIKLTSEIRRKNSEDFSNSSLIRIKKKESEKKGLEVDLFEELGLDFAGGDNEPKKFEGSETKLDSKSKIHRDMEYKLGHMYEDQGLTVVSEEQSKLFTEYNFKGGNSGGAGTDFSGSNFKNSGDKRGYFGDSIDDPMIMNKFKNNSDLRKRPKSKTQGDRKTFMTQPSQENHGFLPATGSENDRIKSVYGKSDSLQKKKKLNINMNKKNQFDSEYLAPIKSINLDAKSYFSNEKNSFEMQEKDSHKHINSSRKSNFKTFGELSEKPNKRINLESLPTPPEPPYYPIQILKYIRLDKEIRKKEYFVEDAFFKLPIGLFYEGNLKFGKMDGKGLLMLKSIDASNRASEEVRKNLLFEGQFEKNEVQGRGILRFKEGVYFEGNFRSGMAHGNGVLFDRNRVAIKEGIWINGNYHN